jgi:hypothetical protein
MFFFFLTNVANSEELMLVFMRWMYRMIESCAV